MREESRKDDHRHRPDQDDRVTENDNKEEVRHEESAAEYRQDRDDRERRHSRNERQKGRRDETNEPRRDDAPAPRRDDAVPPRGDDKNKDLVADDHDWHEATPDEMPEHGHWARGPQQYGMPPHPGFGHPAQFRPPFPDQGKGFRE